MMSLVCGAAAGLISSTATFPLDLVRREPHPELEQHLGRALKKGVYDRFNALRERRAALSGPCHTSSGESEVTEERSERRAGWEAPRGP